MFGGHEQMQSKQEKPVEIRFTVPTNYVKINAPKRGKEKQNGDPWENRTPVFAVRGRRLSRLTKGPLWGKPVPNEDRSPLPHHCGLWIKEKCRHLPIFPGRLQPSIFGTTKLNFCVRNGNRWNLGVIGTGFEVTRNFRPSRPLLLFSLLKLHPCTLKTEQNRFAQSLNQAKLWSSPRPISTLQLNTSPCLHFEPIYLVVFKGSYLIIQWDILSLGRLHA